MCIRLPSQYVIKFIKTRTLGRVLMFKTDFGSCISHQKDDTVVQPRVFLRLNPRIVTNLKTYSLRVRNIWVHDRIPKFINGYIRSVYPTMLITYVVC